MAMEKFLDELFKTELCFQIDEEEINFIRTGVEILVQIIADLVWKNAYEIIKAERADLMKKYPHLEISKNGKYKLSDIIKVGSFYERTKNVYPDQFDYIFLMGVFETNVNFYENDTDIASSVSDLHNCFREVLSTCDISFPSLAERKRYVRFDRYIERKGPASRLRFIYENNLTEKQIYVDLVPAFKILIDGPIDDIASKCWFTGFIDEIKVLSSIIFVQEHISFVETEVHVMNNILSSKHIKAYRLLKYILNTNYGDNVPDSCSSKGQLVRLLGHSKPKLVPSYHLKCVAISHHYECFNIECKQLAPCLFQMMEDIQHVTLITSSRKLFELYMERPFMMTGYKQEILNKTILSLKEFDIKQTNHKARDAESLQGKSAVFSDVENDKQNDLRGEAHSIQSPLIYSEGQADTKHLVTKPKSSLTEKMQYLGLNNIHEGKKHRTDETAISDRPFSSVAIDSKVLPHDIPLLSNDRIVDEGKDRTKASDWFKTIRTYFSNLILIIISGVFAILVFYVLTYRA